MHFTLNSSGSKRSWSATGVEKERPALAINHFSTAYVVEIRYSELHTGQTSSPRHWSHARPLTHLFWGAWSLVSSRPALPLRSPRSRDFGSPRRPLWGVWAAAEFALWSLKYAAMWSAACRASWHRSWRYRWARCREEEIWLQWFSSDQCRVHVFQKCEKNLTCRFVPAHFCKPVWVWALNIVATCEGALEHATPAGLDRPAAHKGGCKRRKNRPSFHGSLLTPVCGSCLFYFIFFYSPGINKRAPLSIDRRLHQHLKQPVQLAWVPALLNTEWHRNEDESCEVNGWMETREGSQTGLHRLWRCRCPSLHTSLLWCWTEPCEAVDTTAAKGLQPGEKRVEIV